MIYNVISHSFQNIILKSIKVGCLDAIGMFLNDCTEIESTAKIDGS